MYHRQMPVDQNLFAEASAAASRVTELEDQLEGAKAEYRRTVRRLHLAGASMREVAEALGISHQRIHQIIEDGGAIDLKLSNFGNSGKVCPLSLPVRLGLYVGGTEKLLHVSGNRSVATV